MGVDFFTTHFIAPLDLSSGNTVTLVGATAVLFTCRASRSVRVVFSDNDVRLSLSDGRTIELPKVLSVSGAQYANPDSSFVFSDIEDTGTVTENGTVTYADCADEHTE